MKAQVAAARRGKVRKAERGRNAILSTSLAMGRLVLARDGVELSDVLRDLEGNIDREGLYSVK